MKSSHLVWCALSPLLAFVPSCGGDDEQGDEAASKTETGTSGETETGTSGETETGTSGETDGGTSSETETGTTGTGTTEGPCTDDTTCIDLGLVCNES